MRLETTLSIALVAAAWALAAPAQAGRNYHGQRPAVRRISAAPGWAFPARSRARADPAHANSRRKQDDGNGRAGLRRYAASGRGGRHAEGGAEAASCRDPGLAVRTRKASPSPPARRNSAIASRTTTTPRRRWRPAAPCRPRRPSPTRRPRTAVRRRATTIPSRPWPPEGTASRLCSLTTTARNPPPGNLIAR